MRAASSLNLLSLGFALLYGGAIYFLHERNAGVLGGVAPVEQGTFSPQGRAEFNTVTLPHDWFSITDAIPGGPVAEGWYRFNFSVDEKPRELYAIYFPTIAENASVYLNGIEIGNGGSFSEKSSRNLPRPLIFPVAPELIANGKNELLLLVESNPPGRGLLPVFYVGSRESLLSAFWDRHSLKVTIPNAITVVMGIYGFLLMLIPMRNSGQKQYLWGGAMMLSFASHSLSTIVSAVPFGPLFWELWQHLSIGLASLFVCLFVNRYFHIQRCAQKKIFGVAVALLFVCSLAMPLLGHQQAYFAWGGLLWGVLALIVLTTACFNLLRGVQESQGVANQALLSSGLLLLIFCVHDVLANAGYIPRLHGHLIHYASPVFAIVLSLILFMRFADSRRDVERLNLELEARVEKKVHELNLSHRHITQLEKQQVAAEERERITRDMHDGIGGYLASALAKAERQGAADIAQYLRDANDEMRLMIDIADSDNEITYAIGSMREKIERRLASENIQLQWRVCDIDVNLTRHSVVINLARIIQESVNNIIKHSNASRVTISLTQPTSGEVMLEISDNGDCQCLEGSGGAGIGNIRARADVIGAKLEFDKSGKLGGLTTSLLLPV